MTYRADLVPLATDSSYSYTSSIEGKSFKFIFSLNERTGIYHMDLFTADASPVLLGVPLLPSNTIASRYSLEEYGLTGYFILIALSETQDFYKINPNDLPKYYTFYYIYEVK